MIKPREAVVRPRDTLHIVATWSGGVHHTRTQSRHVPMPLRPAPSKGLARRRERLNPVFCGAVSPVSRRCFARWLE